MSRGTSASVTIRSSFGVSNSRRRHIWLRRGGVSAGAFALFLSATLLLLAVSNPPPNPRTVMVVQTNADESKLLEVQPALTFGTDPPLPISIRVDDGIRYQQMDGYGASFTDSSAWLVWTRLTPEQREAVMRDLFTPRGANLGFLRQPMGATDLALSNYSYNDLPPGQTDPEMRRFSIEHDEAYILPALRKALELNPRIVMMAVPWSPPGWMKTNGSLNGGGFQTQYLPALAKYFDRFLEAYEASGVPVRYIAVNNEPHFAGSGYPDEETNSYPTMFLTAAQAVELISKHLGPTLERHNRRSGEHDRHVPTQIIGWDHNWDYQLWAETVLRSSSAARFVAGTGFHCYAGNRVVAQRAVQEFFPDKGQWFTECTGVTNFPVFRDNLRFNMRNLVIGAVREGAKSVSLWNMALDQTNGPFVSPGGCKTCRGVITVDWSTTPAAVRYEVEYYALGQAAKFLVNGAHRIESNVADPIDNVAFKNPDGSIVLVTFNAAATSATFSVQWKDETFSYTLPAGSVATFKWSPDQDLSIAASPSSRTVAQAGQTDFRIAVDRRSRSGSDVDLEVEGLPAGVTARVHDGDRRGHDGAGDHDGEDEDALGVTLKASEAAPVGTYSLTFRARTQRHEATSTVKLIVAPREVPFLGVPASLPGRVEIENFNVGGEQVAYHDFDTERRGGANYRAEAVDLEATSDVGGGVNLGFTEPGEWLRYDVDVTAPGNYVLRARVAWPGFGGNFHVEIDGHNVTGNMLVPDTGGFQSWRTIQSRTFPLQAGPQVLRLVLDSTGGGMGNFNWLEVAPAPVSTPFQGAAGAIPGRIEAENFDEGGMNVAYYDETTANQGGAYRTEAVDIEASSDVGGGFNVGFVGEGEWLNYTVNVARSGLYTLKVRVASLPPGGAFYFAVDGRRVTRLITLPHTDGWQNWQTVTVPGVRLPAGAHVLQLIMNSRGYFGAVGNFNWFSFE